MRTKLILMTVMLYATIFAYSQTNEMLNKFERELKAKNESVSTIKCQFKQIQKISVLADIVQKNGDFYFEKPSNMLLAFKDGDYIKMNTEKFEMKMAGNVSSTKISSNPMLRNLRSILSACVIGDFEQMTKGFKVSIEQTPNEWILTLTPERGKMAAKVSSMKISFDKKDMSLNQLKMSSKSGDYTQYIFSQKQFNTKIDSQLFNIAK
ncbi:MAG: outer membrane lipoprotein carrier protein LolA [Bacteroidales bacterium]|nr:outer membrane lipoprotein carrier protein LolA [Bacteroidales bacterium]